MLLNHASYSAVLTFLFWTMTVVVILAAALFCWRTLAYRKLPNIWITSGLICLWLSYALIWFLEPRVYPVDAVSVAVIMGFVGVFLTAKGAEIARPEHDERHRKLTERLREKVMERRREKLRNGS